MELKLTLKDKFDLMLMKNALDSLRSHGMRSLQELNKPSLAWKTETEDELDRLENLSKQVLEQLKQ